MEDIKLHARRRSLSELSHAEAGLPRLESSVRCPAQRHQVHDSPQAETAAANMEASVMATCWCEALCSAAAALTCNSPGWRTRPQHGRLQATNKGADS